MALVKRVMKSKKSSSASSPGGVRKKLPDVHLVKTLSPGDIELGDLSIFLHGGPGVGKTTLSAEFEETYHLMFDPGGKSLEVRQSPITHWLEFVAFIRKIERDKSIRTTVVDGMEDAFDMCFRFMCEEVLLIDHPTDEKDYGKSWNAIYKEYIMQMTNITRMPNKGSIFISHSKESEFRPAVGDPYTVIRPPLPSKVLDPILGKMEVCGCMYTEGDKTWLRIRPDGTMMAKTRPKKHFLYTDGSKVRVIPMGDDSEEGYENFVAAFNNELIRKEGSKKKKLRK